MVTASLILFNTDKSFISCLVDCVNNSCIDILYVIDNSPTNNLQNYTISLSPKIEYVYGHGNIGYGAGHNIAIRKAITAKSTYHVVLNPDIQFSKGTIEDLVDFADKHDDVGMLMPRVVYPDGRNQYLCKLLPTPIDMFGRRLLPGFLINKRNSRFEMRSTGYRNIRNVPCLSGCFMFLNVRALEKVGLFDDRYFMYFEDFDLIRRIHKSFKTVFYPKLTIIHNHAKEHRTSKRLLKISIMSAVKYFNKWGWFFDRDRRLWNRNAFDKSMIISDKL